MVNKGKKDHYISKR